MNKLDKMILEKDRLILRLIEEDEIKVTFEEGNAVTWLRHWKSRKWKKLRNSEEKAGYIEHSVYRYDRRIRIRQHRLVWIYIHREILKPGHVVHHIDENRQNNHIDNLEIRDRRDHLVHGGMYPSQKLTNQEKRQLIKEYEEVEGKLGRNRKGEVKALANKYEIHPTHVWRIVKKHRERMKKQELKEEA